jgi:hypothetical protein
MSNIIYGLIGAASFINGSVILYRWVKEEMKYSQAKTEFLDALERFDKDPNPTKEKQQKVFDMRRNMSGSGNLDTDEQWRDVFERSNRKIFGINKYKL